MRAKRLLREKKYGYWVGVPIPYLDNKGRKLKATQRKLWIRRAQKELTRCFGATTVIPAPGTNILEDGTVLYERGQELVLSACRNRAHFLARKQRIKLFAERMAKGLRQGSVFILACPSDSFLLEITHGPSG